MTFTSLASSSRGNAYVVSDGETTLLLECGLSFRELQKRLGYGVADITACLVSHEHQDHAKAAAQMLKAGVPGIHERGARPPPTRMQWMRRTSSGQERCCGSDT